MQPKANIEKNNIIVDYKQKFLTQKPQTTFNVLKFETYSDLSLEEKNKNSSQNINNNQENLETISDKKNNLLKLKNSRKGRKAKKNENIYSESKHTKFSEDNMMRKIKNKIIESSRLLVNKLFSDEIKNINDKYYYMNKELRKIKGSFSQELNIKFNLYFYQMKIKDIFSLELSHKYTAIDKNSNSNTKLIDYIFSEQNKNYFFRTKKILDMPFHQYYHDIFLGEDKSWKLQLGIDNDDDKYQIDSLLRTLGKKDEENEITNVNNEIYANNINNLAHHYEDFFLSKKMRNVESGDKKEACIKNFMENTTEEEYKKYLGLLQQYKRYYEQRYGIQPEQKIKNQFILNHNFFKIDNLKINEINNNNINNNLNLINFNPEPSSKQLITNKENENKLNNAKNTKEIIFKINNANDFCGKKRKLEEESKNKEKNNNVSSN